MRRLKQGLVLLAGLIVAAVMIALGWWQVGVYQSQGARLAADRAGGAPVALTEVAPAGSAPDQALGRPVRVEGRYQPELQQLLPVPDRPGRYRVLTGLRQDDGSVVAVLRGLSGEQPLAPPAGRVVQTGVLLSSEDPAGGDAAVRLPLLAQTWPGPLVAAYVSLAPAEAAAQGLEPAPVNLPAAPGRLRNGAYALQWWLFAAFAVALAVGIARDLGRGEDLELAEQEAGGPPEAT